MKGAGQDGSGGMDLFFGDDYNYVLQRPASYAGSPAYGVEIGTKDLSTGTSTQHVWRFETDGGLTLPNGATIADSASYIKLTPAGGANEYQALLIYPTAADGNHIHLAAPFGGTTELYLGNDSHYVKLVNGGNVEVRAFDGVFGTNPTWTFGSTGTLTFPNGTNIAIPSGAPRTGAIAITSSTELLIGTNTTTTNNLWTFGIDGSTVLPENTLKGYCFTATNTIFNYIPQSAQFMYTDSPILGLISTIGGPWYIKGPGLIGWKQITAVQDNGGVALIIRIGSGNTPLLDGSEFHSGGYLPTSPDLVYTVSQYLDFDVQIADKTWTFNKDGAFTFPDSTAQTTAYQRNTGSWTLAPGANTVSFTVGANAAYTMWVNGNIPNGIVVWNATLVVSNTNVPVVGTQYGWYYADGNALVLNSIPNQIIGTAGSISSATVATTTSNVFTFGITNNSGSSQIVNWGYVKL
jgi:hypothetical protein